MEPDALISEARAKITWGESASSVHNFLTKNGIADSDAVAIIQECNAERSAEIRRVGVEKILIGAPLTVGAGIFFYFSLKHADADKMDYQAAKSFVAAALVIALVGFYGFWKLMGGIIYLVRPESEEKSISEI